MIGRYLSNTNKIGTIHILQNILELNKALVCGVSVVVCFRQCAAQCFQELVFTIKKNSNEYMPTLIPLWKLMLPFGAPSCLLF
jgi:hypothetical protein